MEEDKGEAENIAERFRGNSTTVAKSDGILQLTDLPPPPSQFQTHTTLRSVQTQAANRAPQSALAHPLHRGVCGF